MPDPVTAEVPVRAHDNVTDVQENKAEEQVLCNDHFVFGTPTLVQGISREVLGHMDHINLDEFGKGDLFLMAIPLAPGCEILSSILQSLGAQPLYHFRTILQSTRCCYMFEF